MNMNSDKWSICALIVLELIVINIKDLFAFRIKFVSYTCITKRYIFQWQFLKFQISLLRKKLEKRRVKISKVSER